MAGTLNLLQLGDEEAHYLGVNVKRKRQQLLLLSSLWSALRFPSAA